MALTVTVTDETVFGDKKIVFATVGFDNSYDAGGELLTPASLGLNTIENVVVLNSNASGYGLGVAAGTSAVNKKLKVYTHTSHTHTLAPTVAEQVTVTSDVGTLAAVPAVISSITDHTNHYTIVGAEKTLATREVHVNWTTGALTFYASDDPAHVHVTYIPVTVPSGTGGAEASGDLSSVLSTVYVMVIGW